MVIITLYIYFLNLLDARNASSFQSNEYSSFNLSRIFSCLLILFCNSFNFMLSSLSVMFSVIIITCSTLANASGGILDCLFVT